MAFRDLRADEIDVRIQSVKNNGVVALLFKDARTDMNILDETVGAANWQREHYECKGNMYCRVGIWDDVKEQWVWKSDCGTESNTEAEKGEASDSFKRACVNWGIGRELYTSPFIWIPADKCRIENGKCYDKFTVKEIVIENKVIVGLAILNGSNLVYTFGKCAGGHQSAQAGSKVTEPINTAPTLNPPPASPRDVLVATLKQQGQDVNAFALARGLNKNTSSETYIAILSELGVNYNA